MAVQVLHDLLDRHDRKRRHVPGRGNLGECGFVAGAPLHAIDRDHQTGQVDVGCCTQHGDCLANGRARGCDIFDDHHAITILGDTAYQSPALAMVLDFLAVETEADVVAVVADQSHRCSGGQWNSLVGGPEENIEIATELIANRAGIELRETGQLATGSIAAGIDEVGSISSALGHKITESQNFGSNHEFDEFAFIGRDLACHRGCIECGDEDCTAPRIQRRREIRRVPPPPGPRKLPSIATLSREG